MTEVAEDSEIAGRLPAVAYEEEMMPAAGTGSRGAAPSTLPPLHGGGRVS